MLGIYIDDEHGQDQTTIFGNDNKGRTRFTQKDLFMCKNIPEMNMLACIHAFLFIIDVGMRQCKHYIVFAFGGVHISYYNHIVTMVSYWCWWRTEGHQHRYKHKYQLDYYIFAIRLQYNWDDTCESHRNSVWCWLTVNQSLIYRNDCPYVILCNIRLLMFDTNKI